MSAYWQRVRSFSSSLWRLLFAAWLVLVVWLGLLAVLYNLYLLRLGLDVRTIGLLSGLGALVWGIAALPAGLLSNRIGLRSSIQLGMILYGLGIALTLLVEGIPPPQWQTWLLGSQIIMNIGIAFATVNVPPYIMTVAQPAERPYAFAILSALNPVAAFAGSLMAGVLPGLFAAWQGVGLDQPGPYRLALWVGPLLCCLGALPLVRTDPGIVPPRAPASPSASTRHGATPAQSQAPMGLFAFWGLIVFLAAAGEGTVRTFFNVLLDTSFHVPPATIGLTIGLAQLLPIGMALAVPLLFTRWGAGYTLLGGILMLALSLIPLAFGAFLGEHGPAETVQVLWLIATAYLAAAVTLAVIRAARNLFGQELVQPHWRTASQGATMLGLAFGLSAAGTVGGMLIAAFGFSVLFLASALAALLSALCLLAYLHHAARHRAVAVEPM